MTIGGMVSPFPLLYAFSMNRHASIADYCVQDSGSSIFCFALFGVWPPIFVFAAFLNDDFISSFPQRFRGISFILGLSY